METNKIFNEDCLIGMKEIPNEFVDLIFCDLPYGQTQNEWDSQIPLDALFTEYNRIIKPRGYIILFGQGMFTADLMKANAKDWKYNLVWDKVLSAGFLNANKMPLRVHEDIIVFYKQIGTYNPQKVLGQKNHSKGKKKQNANNNYGSYEFLDNSESLGNLKHPNSIISISKPHPSKMIHPTEKPLKLGKWIIRTYSNEGDIVLDNAFGSGTFLLAAKLENRQYIGYETKEEYFKIAEKRLNEQTLNGFALRNEADLLLSAVAEQHR